MDSITQKISLSKTVAFVLIFGLALFIGQIDFLGGLVSFAVMLFYLFLAHRHSVRPIQLLLYGSTCVATSSIAAGVISWFQLSSAKQRGDQLMFDPLIGAVYATSFTLFFSSVVVGTVALIYLLSHPWQEKM